MNVNRGGKIMLMTPNFKRMTENGGDLTISRKGLANQVVIPNNLLQRSGFDANIVDNSIVFSEGSSTYILADKIALGTTLGEAEVNIFFVDNGMMLELVEGQIVLFDNNNDPFIVDQDAEIEYVKVGTRIRVMDVADLREKAEMIIKNRYGLNNPSEISEYTDNLLINALLSYSSSGGEPCLSVRIPDLYEDLGLEQFNYVNYRDHQEFVTKKDKDDHIDVSELDDEDLFEDDEDEEDEFDMTHDDDNSDDF